MEAAPGSATGGLGLVEGGVGIAVERIGIVIAAMGNAERGADVTLLRLGREDSIWEAVLVVRDGAVFGFVADGEHACLRAADGQGGCFTLPRAAQE